MECPRCYTKVDERGMERECIYCETACQIETLGGGEEKARFYTMDIDSTHLVITIIQTHISCLLKYKYFSSNESYVLDLADNNRALQLNHTPSKDVCIPHHAKVLNL